MRLPLVQRVRPRYACLVAVLFALAQWAEGTSLPFAALSACYILVSALAFNAAGGLTHTSGAFIFSTSLLTALIGLTFKILLGEPGDSTLAARVVTLAAYCGGMAVMGVCAFLVQRFVPTGGLLPRFESDESMKQAAIGSLVIGIVLTVFTSGGDFEDGSIASAIRQINYFVPMAIVLGTFYEVRRSRGRASTNWVVWVGICWTFALGLIGFSKQGLISPWVSWLVAAIAAGHHFTRRRIFLLLLGVVFFETYLLPFTETGRNFRSDAGKGSVAADTRTAIGMLQHLGQTRQTYLEARADPANGYSDRPHFYNRPHGLFDRLVMLPPDDALIAYTEQGNFAGLAPTVGAFANVIPHFLWKNKSYYFVGNQYAREIGMIADDNDVTGISFSPTADAYHQAGWYGIFVLLPPIFLVLFAIFDWIGGDLRHSPWAMFLAIGCSHYAPEGAIGGQIYFGTYGVFGIILVAIIAKYVLPPLARVLTHSEPAAASATRSFLPVLHPRAPGPLTPPKSS